MKYVMFEVKLNLTTMSVPVLFPNLVVHKEVADAMAMCLRRHWRGAEIKPVSAGFISQLEVAKAHGKSESMGDLESRPIDADIIMLGGRVE